MTATEGIMASDMGQLSPTGRFERILLATDGSDYSDGAQRVAIAMCAEGGARLTVMTAVLSSPELSEIGPSQMAQMEAEAAEHLDAVAAEATRQGVDCDKVIRYGDDPYREIVAEAEESNVDLIVVGRRGKRGLARLMLGDATVKVIGDASCSVLVVPRTGEMWKRRILLCTDGSRSSDAAATAAARISECCGSPLTVLSVEVPAHSEERQAEAAAIVDRVLSFYREAGLEADGLVRRGTAHDVIAEVAGELGADLIIMGSHGRTGWGRLLLGSNSERVIGNATCPVLVVKGG